VISGVSPVVGLQRFEEIRELIPSRDSNFATRVAKGAIGGSRCVNATTRSASSTCCSNEGAEGIAGHDGSTAKATCLPGKSQYGQVKGLAPLIEINEPRRKGPEQLP